MIRTKDFESAWLRLLDSVLSSYTQHSRVGATREVLGQVVRIEDPRSTLLWNPIRKLSESYAAAEFLWYLSGDNDASLIKHYAPSYKNYLDDGVHAYGAYGARWARHKQISRIWRILRKAEDSRQAIMTCWSSEDITVAMDGSSKDIPCTLTLQFLVRDGYLNLIVNMRSNDLWMGMPYDVYCFTRLQIILAKMLDLDIGFYQHSAGSLHLYEKHWMKAKAALRYESQNTFDDCESLLYPTCPQDLFGAVDRTLTMERKIREERCRDFDLVAHNLGGTNTFFYRLAQQLSKKWIQ